MHRVTTTNPKTILTTSKARSNDRDGFHRINIEQANTIPVTFGSNKSFPFAGWSATIAAPFLFPDSDFGVPDSSSGSTSLDEELSAPSFILVLSGSTTHCDAPDAPEGDDAAEVFRSFGIRMRCKAVLSGEDFPSILSPNKKPSLIYAWYLNDLKCLCLGPMKQAAPCYCHHGRFEHVFVCTPNNVFLPALTLHEKWRQTASWSKMKLQAWQSSSRQLQHSDNATLCNFFL